MPKDIFSPLPTAAAAKEVRSTVYLTDEKIGWIGEMGKTVKSPQAKVCTEYLCETLLISIIDQEEESSSSVKVKVSAQYSRQPEF
jgi:hypothetical protein